MFFLLRHYFPNILIFQERSSLKSRRFSKVFITINEKGYIMPEGNDTHCNRYVSDTPSLSHRYMKLMMDTEHSKHGYYSECHFPQV